MTLRSGRIVGVTKDPVVPRRGKIRVDRILAAITKPRTYDEPIPTKEEAMKMGLRASSKLETLKLKLQSCVSPSWDELFEYVWEFCYGTFWPLQMKEGLIAYAYSGEYRDYIDTLSWDVDDRLRELYAEMDPQSRPSDSLEMWNIQGAQRLKNHDTLLIRAAESLPGYVPDSERPCLRKAEC